MPPRRSPPESAPPGLFDALEPPGPPPPLSVTELTRTVAERLAELGRLRVEGELSGVKRAASGHLYFDLKDEAARVSCVIWRSQLTRAVRFEPEEGMRVVASGRIDVYPPRGSYSLVVERLEPQGLGALLLELERLKAELRALGWFERRRPLPAFPRCIGVVTSRDGAALRDVLRTRSLRWPGYPLRLRHTSVQGPGAALEIAAAIRALEASGVDVIAVVRGGGSLEDLWAFNERAVAEAIHAAGVPVVSGIGHESDTTLADLVADHRAHTPTDAAQTLIPARGELERELARWGNFLVGAMTRVLEDRAERLASAARRPVLRDADWILGRRREALATHRARLRAGCRAALERAEGRVAALSARLERQAPAAALERRRARVARAGRRLLDGVRRRLEEAEAGLRLGARALEGISPLRVLERGYALVRRAGDPRPLREAGGLVPGDEIEAVLWRGTVRSRVERVERGADPAADGGPARP